MSSIGLREKDSIELSRLIGHVTSAGAPLEASLAALARNLPHGRLRRFLAEIAHRLHAGESIEAILADRNTRVPSHLRGLIAAGLKSGALPAVLQEYLRHRESQRLLRSQVIARLLYPGIMFAFSLATCWFALGYMVPNFKRIVTDFGIDLPDAVVLVVALSDAFVYFQSSLLILLIGLFVVVFALVSSRWGRKLLFLVPLIGSAGKWTSASGFCRMLAIFVRRDLPLPYSLRLLSDAIHRSALREFAFELAQRAEQGASLAQAVAESNGPLEGTVPLLTWGQENQSLAATLDILANIYEERAKSIGALVTGVLPILFYFATVFMIAGAMFVLIMPIIKLLVELGR